MAAKVRRCSGSLLKMPWKRMGTEKDGVGERGQKEVPILSVVGGQEQPEKVLRFLLG